MNTSYWIHCLNKSFKHRSPVKRILQLLYIHKTNKCRLYFYQAGSMKTFRIHMTAHGKHAPLSTNIVITRQRMKTQHLPALPAHQLFGTLKIGGLSRTFSAPRSITWWPVMWSCKHAVFNCQLGNVSWIYFITLPNISSKAALFKNIL